MTRSLLLKGLAGVAALGGTVGGLAVYRKEIFGWGKAPEEPESEDVSKFNQKELIDKVGLNCQLTDGETEVNGTKDCTVKENGTIKVKVGDKEEEGVTFTTNGSKLKVSKSDEVRADGGEKYNKKLKFVVDSGDITLNKGASAATTIPKLEQFETYEVFLRDGKFYLRRKTDAKEEKIKALRLPSSCTLPDTGDSNCSLSKEEIKTVNFEKKSGEEITVSSGEVRLKISKMTDSTDFTDGYRFTFTFPSEVTINNKSLKANTPYDFKIKKPNTGNAITLEKAWSEDNAFSKKAGLDCTNTNECSIPANSQNLNVKVGTKTKEGITNKTGSGKIKMETGQAGYNQGLKFTITEGDVTWTTTGGDDISKLEEYETYEITEEGGKYYLTRKTGKEGAIRSSLGLPENCNLPSSDQSVECVVSAEHSKSIKFNGKEDGKPTGEIKLKIEKAEKSSYPLGYKFTLLSTSDVQFSSSDTVKANTNTVFKIKKESSSLKLEKAWGISDLLGKVGLSGCTDDNSQCSIKNPSGPLNIKRNGKALTTTSISDGGGKIKFKKDQANYSQGFKFTIEDNDITLSGGTAPNEKLEELETYEITEEGGNFYLTRKNEASKTIMDLLGLADAGCSLSGTSSTCSNLNTEKLQKIKFDGKENLSIASSGTASLTITSGADKTDFPLGYKFTLQSGHEITIKSDNKVKANIPTEFKIKKAESGQTPALSLEKAWTAESLGKKVGLDCKVSSGTECCSMTSGSSEKLNVERGGDKKEDITSFSGGKIKVEKDQAGYNQGLKFTIDGGDVTLTGGSKTGSSDISKLEEYETYEITEEGGKYYLSRKSEAIVFLKKALGLDFCTKETFGSIYTCDIKEASKLQGIKFENMSGHTNWPTGAINIQLSIEKESSGLKFTFNDTESNSSGGSWCIPDGKGGSLNLKDSRYSASGPEYRIKKTGSGTGVSLTLEKKDK